MWHHLEEFKYQVSEQVTRTTPAIAGTVGSILTSNEILTICTIVYVVIQAGYLLRKWYREEKAHAKKQSQIDPETVL